MNPVRGASRSARPQARPRIAAALAQIPESQRLLAAWPEPELEREALVKAAAITSRLAPRLRALGLWDEPAA